MVGAGVTFAFLRYGKVTRLVKSVSLVRDLLLTCCLGAYSKKVDTQTGSAPSCVAWNTRTGGLACGCADGSVQVSDNICCASCNFEFTVGVP